MTLIRSWALVGSLILAVAVGTARSQETTDPCHRTLKCPGCSSCPKKECATEHRLEAPVSIDFKDTPLRQAVEDMGVITGLNIVVDRPALCEEGVSLDQPVTIKLESVACKSALKMLLQQVHLVYVVKDEVVQVTSEKQAWGKPVCRTYPIGDLHLVCASPDCPLRKVAEEEFSAECLIKLITTAVAPHTWSCTGGAGTIDYFPMGKALVISQSPHVQEQVADLLETLRRRQEEQKAHEAAARVGDEPGCCEENCDAGTEAHSNGCCTKGKCCGSCSAAGKCDTKTAGCCCKDACKCKEGCRCGTSCAADGCCQGCCKDCCQGGACVARDGEGACCGGACGHTCCCHCCCGQKASRSNGPLVIETPAGKCVIVPFPLPAFGPVPMPILKVKGVSRGGCPYRCPHTPCMAYPTCMPGPVCMPAPAMISPPALYAVNPPYPVPPPAAVPPPPPVNDYYYVTPARVCSAPQPVTAARWQLSHGKDGIHVSGAFFDGTTDAVSLVGLNVFCEGHVRLKQTDGQHLDVTLESGRARMNGGEITFLTSEPGCDDCHLKNGANGIEITGYHFEGSCDRVTVVEEGSIVLEGHVCLKYGLNGCRARVTADRVCIGIDSGAIRVTSQGTQSIRAVPCTTPIPTYERIPPPAPASN